MSADRYALRAAEVWRRHRPTGRDMSGRRSWANLTHENGALLGVVMFLILQVVLEPALWWSWPPWRGSRELFGGIALGLLAVAPVSGVLLERYLAHRTPPGMVLRPGARLALWFLGSIPLAGYLLIPLARRWMDGGSFRAWRPVAGSLDLDSPPAPLPRGSLRQWTYVSGAFGIWLAVTGVLLPIAGCLWLAATGQRTAILTACAVLHLAQAGCLAVYARSDPRFVHQVRRKLRLASCLCLFPLPVTLLALAVILWAEAGSRQETLTWSAYAQAGSVRRHSQWLDLRLALRQQWQASSWSERWTRPKGLELPQRNGRVEAARRTWIRAKALILPVEASLVIGWLAAITVPGPEPSYDPFSDAALRPWLLAASLLATLGLLQSAAGFFARLLRLRPPAILSSPTVGLYLFITQAALAFGLLAGPLAAHGKFRHLVLLAVFAGALAMALSFLLMALSNQLSSRMGALIESTAWPFGPLLLGFLPFPLAWFPGQATIVISALTVVILSVGVLLGLRYLPWILHPFTLRDLFDRRLASGSRAALGFSALMVLFPLGGLALPIWIWTRQGRRRRNLCADIRSAQPLEKSDNKVEGRS